MVGMVIGVFLTQCLTFNRYLNMKLKQLGLIQSLSFYSTSIYMEYNGQAIEKLQNRNGLS